MTITDLSPIFSLRMMALLTNLFALLGCAPTAQHQLTRGSLAIGYWLDREHSLNVFTNGELIGSHTTSYFTIHYQGKPVVIKNKQGQKVPIWQARFLADAPKPAVLATSNGIYLITEADGQARITPVVDAGTTMSRYQWLDSEQGQPGQSTISYPMDNSTTERFLSGGRYLLVDNSYSQFLPGGLNACSVLDVHTLRVHPLDWSSPAALEHFDGFVRVSPNVVSCSPGKTQLVFLGKRYNSSRNRTEYALLAVDFVGNQRYAVPFGAWATQFSSAEDATPDWASVYFEWTPNQTGEEVLRLRPYTHPPAWHGRWAQDAGVNAPLRYEVKRVGIGMFAHFMAWAKARYPTLEPKIDQSEGMIRGEFSVNGSVVRLSVRSEDQCLVLASLDQPLLKSMGEEFEGELRRGRFQDGFIKRDPRDAD